MTFRQFAFNNVMRNKRTYAAYFLSSTFSVLVFFIYAIFAFHPSLRAINVNVAVGLHFAEGIIYVFSFLFVLISMSAFLKSRKKEFGLMVMLGMTNMQLRRMVFLENVFIGFFATLSGMGLGLVFGKLLLLAAENILKLEETLPFYLPIQALLLTFIAFMLLFVIISFTTVSILKGNKLIDLIKGSAAPKKEPKSSIALSIIAILLLAIGYTGALIVRGMEVTIAMIPVTIVVTIGTYFLFTQLSVYTIHRLRKRKSLFWKKTNMLLFSDLAYRMKDNARTFFFVAIVSTVTFSAIGSLVGFRSMMTNAIVQESPFAFTYLNEGDKQETEHIQLIKKELDAYPYKEASVKVKKVLIENTANAASIVSVSEFNRLAELSGEKAENIHLQGNEAISLQFEATIGVSPEIDKQESIRLAGNDVVLERKDVIYSNVFADYRPYIIVADSLFADLQNVESEQSYHAFYIKDWKETLEAGKNLTKVLDYYGDGYQFRSLAVGWNDINQGYGAILFVGLFIGAVFFVAAGSFLYFRLYADLDDEKQKFKAIGKLGITDKELSKVLTIQLGLLFFVPIIVAVIHGAVALTALQNMFNFNLAKESALVLASFAGIQVIYFLFIRANYIRKIKRAM
ncbi:ABC transporter permease [Bacillus sp. FJAT-50079]|uniref:FtsX-like permease family protein n=1 Tax=Bacillus sp. FJAT-50079 TaxID=2833577 RepID=UPI001BCA4955|nr:ABC transporter permease [Bacillus sp. FJAT-50079]MBS4210104.1 ABC transporter permease [Bacillus sp. FJAT-50079]